MIIDRTCVEEALPAYEIADTLGQGGYGLVLAGRHRRLERDVAVKVLSAGPTGDAGEAQGRFETEARLLANLDHPHVVRIYDYVEADDLCLLVMERLPGGTMRARAAKGLTTDVVCAVGLACAAALECAHTGNVLHRDIKPDNMLFASDGLLKVTDFGIAKLVGDSGAVASTLVGTPAYMAPEQIDGRPLGPGIDLYAIGVVLYELLTGRPPFPRSMPVMELMHHHLYVTPAPLTSAPPAIGAVVERALRKDARERQPSAHAFGLDLAKAAAQALGPGWLARCPMPLRLDDEIRDAARSNPAGAPAPQHPHQPGRATAGEAPRADPGGTVLTGIQPATRPTPPPSPPHLSPPAESPPAMSPQPISLPPPSPPAVHLPPPMTQEPTAQTPLPPATPPAHPAPPPSRPGIPPPASASPPAGEPPATRTRRWGISGAARAVGLGRGARRRNRPGAAAAPVTTAATPTSAAAGPLRVDYPYCIAVSPDGTLFVSQRLRNRVVRLDPDGSLTHIAGTGKSGMSGDGGHAVHADMDNPCGLALSTDGALLIADSFNNRIRRVSPDGLITTVAGTGYLGPPPGPAAQHATSLALAHPHGVAVDAAGRLYIANTDGHQVIGVDPDGRAAVLVGVGLPGMTGDGGASQFAQLRRPHDVAAAPGGVVYVADTDNRCVRMVEPKGTISTVAGVFYGGASGERVPALSADLGRPHALACMESGELVVTDPNGGRVRMLTSGMVVRTLGEDAFTNRAGRPLGVAIGPDGTIYIADTARHVIHRIRHAAATGYA